MSLPILGMYYHAIFVLFCLACFPWYNGFKVLLCYSMYILLMDTWVFSHLLTIWIVLIGAFESLFSNLLGIYLGVKLLGHMVILCWTFWGTAKLFSTVASNILHSHRKCTKLLIFPHLCQHLILFWFFDTSHLSMCRVVLIILICVSPMTNDIEDSSCVYWTFVYHLYIFKVLCPLF